MMIEKFHKDIVEIEKKLQYTFQHKELLLLAFTHRSFVNENKERVEDHNERLEFLGDAILGVIVSEFLYKTLPTYKEGQLSYLRSRLVDASTCALYMQKLSVAEHLLLGKGEMMNAGKGRDSIIADLFEAILGAIYVDAGLEGVKQFFLHHFARLFEQLIKEPIHNWKAMLQDHFQKKFQKQPIYKLLRAEGPDHEKVFYIGVYLEDKELGMGTGLSKKEAEQKAAHDAIKKLL